MIGIEYRQDGAIKQLRARREVLLCAGALQSPQLLMLSGIGPADHLQQAGDRDPCTICPGSARNLHDHPDVVQVVDAPQLKDLFGLSIGRRLAAA